MKKKLPPGRTPQDARAAAEKNWEKVKQDMANGIIDRDAIVQAMSWLNEIDGEEVQKRESDYMQKRKKLFVDADKLSDDEEIDKNHEHLRQQYQVHYGKDVKHG